MNNILERFNYKTSYDLVPILKYTNDLQLVAFEK